MGSFTSMLFLIFRIDDQIAHELLGDKNEDRNIAEIVPMVAPNMILHFPNKFISPATRQIDSPLQKVFEL